MNSGFLKTLSALPWLLSFATPDGPARAAAFQWSTVQDQNQSEGVAALGLIASGVEPNWSNPSELASTLTQWLSSRDLLENGCALVLAGQSVTGLTEHYAFKVICTDLPILGSRWHLHTARGELVMVNESAVWDLETLAPTDQTPKPVAADFALAPPAETDRILHQTRGWAPGSFEEAWEQAVASANGSRQELRLVSVHSGEILARQPHQFDALTFNIFATNQLDPQLTAVAIATNPGGFLSSPEGVRAYGGDKTKPRLTLDSKAQDQDLRGGFSPADPAQAGHFDQLQGFYTADKAQKWFSNHFGFKMEKMGMDVFTDSLQDGTPNNARYQPATGSSSAALIIGQGDGKNYRNLGRDTDVIFHEFSHHIIYRSLKVSYGETGILHEGTADYFAYAMNGDPFLGESVRVGAPYLRTAKLEAGRRFDDPKNPRGAHDQGQYWSAVLWAVRDEIGAEAMDQIVYHGIDYLPAAATIADFFEGLLSADRDLFPDADGGPDAPRFGLHQCTILRHGLERGFASSLGKIDGARCQLDLQSLAEASRLARQNSSADLTEGSDEEESNLFQGCGTIGGDTTNSTGWWLVLPLAAILSRGQRRSSRGKIKEETESSP